MASGQWQLTAQQSAAAATVTQTAVATGGQAIRLRSLTFTLSGTSAGAITCVVRDGATGTGTIIWQGSLNCAANGSASIALQDQDLRATSGSLTVESTGSGGSNTTTSVNAGGDLVQIGYPAYGP